MKRLLQPVIFSDIYKLANGAPAPMTALFTEREKHHIAFSQKMVNERFGNSLGFEVPITTLTAIVKKVSEQKLYQIAPADYVPIKVGEATWSGNITTYRSFDVAAPFEEGIINSGSNNTRLSSNDAAVDALNIKVNNWAKNVGWSIMELEQAAKSGDWDLVSAKEKSRKRNWDLGIQKTAFLGLKGQNSGANATCLGLLNQATGQFDATLITTKLSAMSSAQLSTFQQASISRYRTNCNFTAFPTHFVIPELDYNGLVAQASDTFPMKSKLQLLEEGFQVVCRNKNFKILPLAYADFANGGGVLPAGVTSGLYTFLNYDEESIRMDVPLQYTNTLANSLDNFMFQNAGYGQFTGVLAYRPLELYYAGF